jgi:ParB family chromosome partitioning protein
LGGAFLINLDRIRPDPSQPRTVFNAAALNELATSIRRLGVVQPISARYIPADDIYQIISGERRFQASKLAGLSTIPAVIANPDENEILVRQLVENWHRQDLNPFDLADSLVQLRDANKYSQKQLADVMGKSESEISKLLKLLDLAPDIQKQERVRLDKALSFKHLYEIARLLPDEQVVVVAAAREQKLTAAQTGKLVSHTIQRRSLAPKRGAPVTRVQYVTTKARISIVFRKQSVTNDEILAALDEAR